MTAKSGGVAAAASPTRCGADMKGFVRHKMAASNKQGNNQTNINTATAGHLITPSNCFLLCNN